MTEQATPTPPAPLPEPELSKNNNITKIHHTEPSELEYREWAMEICNYDGFGLTRDRAVQVLKRLRQEWLDTLAADNARLREQLAMHMPNAEFCPHCNPCRNGEAWAKAERLNMRYDAVLRGLASYVGAGGLGDLRLIDPDVADEKIRWGIKHITEVEAKRRENAESELARLTERVKEVEAANLSLAVESERLKSALRFYAHGDHFVEFDTWEGPSGDENWLCPPSMEFSDYQEFIDDLEQHMLEDGGIARAALAGKEIDWEGDEPKEHPCEPVMKAIAEAEKEDAAIDARRKQ